jgi:hypothetical protein
MINVENELKNLNSECDTQIIEITTTIKMIESVQSEYNEIINLNDQISNLRDRMIEKLSTTKFERNNDIKSLLFSFQKNTSFKKTIGDVLLKPIKDNIHPIINYHPTTHFLDALKRRLQK